MLWQVIKTYFILSNALYVRKPGTPMGTDADKFTLRRATCIKDDDIWDRINDENVNNLLKYPPC